MRHKKVLLIGSGPIQIGQGCEFDYSGTQAALALREEGYEVVLVNSNPASIMTDPSTASRIYIEPLCAEVLEKIALAENVGAVAPTFGGQFGLNLFMELEEKGFWKKHGISALGVEPRTVQITEDRFEFQRILKNLGLETIRNSFCKTVEEGLSQAKDLGFPVIVRASFTLGGSGGGIAQNEAELVRILEEGFRVSPLAELSIEENISGWKEFELEVMRDSQGCFLVVCGVENVNPMGVHTGDSITVSPCMTLTDKEYQRLRDLSRIIFDAVGLRIGGANIQFAIHPVTGRLVVVEMNPRVSRSSALVSKATGYPIARIAARLAAGRSLMDLRNEVTQVTSAFFEPSIDYVAVKIPLWDTHRFEGASPRLGIQMKSVGEVLSFGRTFRDAFEKAWISLERGYQGWPDLREHWAKTGCLQKDLNETILEQSLSEPSPALFPAIKSAFDHGFSINRIHALTRISFFFLDQLEQLHAVETQLRGLKSLTSPQVPNLFKKARQDGLTLEKISSLTGFSVEKIAGKLDQLGISAGFRMVDTCAGEFSAETPFYYRTVDSWDENRPSVGRKKVVVLGSGPNRIGQGVEFDASCVHAIKGAQKEGYEAIMINCNPETVSTDFLIPDKLFMEPLAKEHVLDILSSERPDFVLLQFGGQSPLKLAEAISQHGYQLAGTPLQSIQLAEDRRLFGEMAAQLEIRVPKWDTCSTASEGLEKAAQIGFPLLVRPSYVLGGGGMEMVRSADELKVALEKALLMSSGPILLDQYLEGAREYDVDLLFDGTEVLIPEIMEHLEEAGIHSGDSSCVVPPRFLSLEIRSEIESQASRLAMRLEIKGLLNIQFAVLKGKLYVLEVNPRSSRSVPFLSKSTGVHLAYWASRIALGQKLKELQLEIPSRNWDAPPEPLMGCAIKAPVFPFSKFPGVLPALGPQMQSIGESMSWGADFSEVYHKVLMERGFNTTAWAKGNETSPLKVVVIASEIAIGLLQNSLEVLGNKKAEFLTLPEMAKWLQPLGKVNSLSEEQLLASLEGDCFVWVPRLVGQMDPKTRNFGDRVLRKAQRKRVLFSCSALQLEAFVQLWSNETFNGEINTFPLAIDGQYLERKHSDVPTRSSHSSRTQPRGVFGSDLPC